VGELRVGVKRHAGGGSAISLPTQRHFHDTMSSNVTPFSLFPASTTAPCAFGLFGQNPRDTHATYEELAAVIDPSIEGTYSQADQERRRRQLLRRWVTEILWRLLENRIFSSPHPLPHGTSSVGASHPSSCIILRLWLIQPQIPHHHHTSTASPKPKRQRASHDRIAPRREIPPRDIIASTEKYLAVHVPSPRTPFS
jgi:hypothetical protein